MKQTIDQMNAELPSIMLEVVARMKKQHEDAIAELEEIQAKSERNEYTIADAPAVITRIKELRKLVK